MGKEDGFALQCKSVAKCIYRTKGECDKKNGHQPVVVPFTCISQKSTTKETFTIASFMYLLQKESKIKAHLLLFIFTAAM